MRLRRLLIALAGLALVVVATAGPAAAHAVLESTSPASGEAVAESPEVIELDFSEPVEVSLGAIRLFDASGRELDVGESRHPSGDDTRVVATSPELGDGSFVVSWRVVSADSHPINGAFTFDVGEGGSSDDARGLVARLVNSSGSPTVGAIFVAVKWAGYAAVGLVVGGLVFGAWIWRGARLARMGRGLWRAALAGVVATVLAIAFQGAYAGGYGLSKVLDPTLWWDVASTRYGRAHLLRLVLFAVAAVVARWAGTETERLRRRPAQLGIVMLSIGLALSVAFSGHADTGRWIAVAMSADVVHVLAFSVWFGGLWALLAWGLRDGQDGDASIDDVVVASRRFSNAALGAVVVVSISGVVQGWRQVGDWAALTSTTYGRLLLVKVGLVVVVVGVAWVSRALVRAMAAPEPEPETEDDDPDDDDPDDDEPVAGIARRYLRRSVGVEVAGIVAILVVSTLLASVIPAREAEGLPFDQTVVTDQGFGQFTVDPAKAGTTAIHVIVTGLDGTPPDIAEMDVELRLPERDVGPIDVPMTRLAPGHYVNDEATIPFPGTWTITANALVGEFDQLTFEVTVPVR